MVRGGIQRGVRIGVASGVVLLVACGASTRVEPDGAGASMNAGNGGTSSGGTAGGGNGGTSSGGTGGSGGEPRPPLLDCDSVTTCKEPGAHCGGPCSNSWQADFVCATDGTWQLEGVVACGPNADEAPECKNAFSGGTPGPCCPAVLECADKPDGYPGFACVAFDNSFCSCSCFDGEQVCGC